VQSAHFCDPLLIHKQFVQIHRLSSDNVAKLVLLSEVQTWAEFTSILCEELAEAPNMKVETVFHDRCEVLSWFRPKAIVHGIAFEVTFATKSPPASEGPGDTFTVFVRTLTGKDIRLCVTESDTIDTIKRMVYNQEGILLARQRLMLSGNVREDGNTLEYYSILQGIPFILLIVIPSIFTNTVGQHFTSKTFRAKSSLCMFKEQIPFTVSRLKFKIVGFIQ